MLPDSQGRDTVKIGRPNEAVRALIGQSDAGQTVIGRKAESMVVSFIFTTFGFFHRFRRSRLAISIRVQNLKRRATIAQDVNLRSINHAAIQCVDRSCRVSFRKMNSKIQNEWFSRKCPQHAENLVGIHCKTQRLAVEYQGLSQSTGGDQVRRGLQNGIQHLCAASQ